MNGFEHDLGERLRVLRDNGLLRELRRIESAQGRTIRFNGRSLLNFSSNDYLGLATHPALQEAAARGMRDFGVGSGASRLVCGSLKPHHDLEEAISLSDRVVVLSAGPATRPIGEFAIDLPRPRDVAEIRMTPAFVDLHREIWQLLKGEVQKAYAAGAEART